MKNRQLNVALREFNKLVPQVSKQAARNARGVLGKSKSHLVDEVVNDVLRLLWNEQVKRKLPEKLESWVRTVAQRQAARLAKAEGRYPLGLLDGNEDLSESEGYAPMPSNEQSLFQSSEKSPFHCADMAERFSALKRLLDLLNSSAENLSRPDYLLFDLLYNRGLSVDEAAKELNLSQDAVRQQWSRMVKKLRTSVLKATRDEPLCNELLATVLKNEETFGEKLVGLLRLVMDHGVVELEKLVKSVFSR